MYVMYSVLRTDRYHMYVFGALVCKISVLITGLLELRVGSPADALVPGSPPCILYLRQVAFRDTLRKMLEVTTMIFVPHRPSTAAFQKPRTYVYSL